MGIMDNYVDFFKIDPEYLPVVDERAIIKNPDLWKKYYPHFTFVDLINNTEKVLSRRINKSIWVDGAYGTGKSHAVLTLKKLLDANENETREYFDKYSDELSQDLFSKLMSVKNSGKIITVHHYGSSSVFNDRDLITVIQEGIISALNEAGIENKGNSTLKNAIIKWLSDEINENYFNSLIEKKYKELFAGDNVNNIIEKLQTFENEALSVLLKKIFRVADESGINALSMTIDDLTDWIKDIINVNELKAIVFIWDEFTEFFTHTNDLTGFQKIAETSSTEPFYLIIVTHKREGLFNDGAMKKLLDRFVPCHIELPENMAFKLMGKAMEKTDDKLLLEEWEQITEALYERTHDSRTLVMKRANIGEKELKDVLPIHPYSALLLKHMATAFASNQRSMFDFIKSSTDEQTNGFQWFIENYSPYDDDNPLLTVDLLWEFFYSKKDNLNSEIRTILDSYSIITSTRKLDIDKTRVLKAVLLLQAISQSVGNSVDLFIPDEKNLDNAFEGSDLENGNASNCANKLVKDEILYRKPIGQNRFQYSVFVQTGNKEEIDKLKEQVKENSLTKLVEDGNVLDAINLKSSLRLRYNVNYACTKDFDYKVRKITNEHSLRPSKIELLITFALNESDSTQLRQKINEVVKNDNNIIVFVDTSLIPLGTESYDKYVNSMANSMYQKGKDNSQAITYELQAKEELRRWKTRIAKGEFYIASQFTKELEIKNNLDAICEELLMIDQKVYRYCLEGEYTSLIDNMYMSNLLAKGVECGIKQETSSTYRTANPKQKLENALEGAWGVDEYWEKSPHLLISIIKRTVDSQMSKAFNDNGRISIRDIYDTLVAPPFGFMPCNLSAFIMGFVLKEYASGYSYTDNTSSDNLDIEKMKELISEVIKNQLTPSTKYRDKYIVSMTDAEKAFFDATAKIFKVDRSSCSSTEVTRDIIRSKMKYLSFPIWCLKGILNDDTLVTDPKVISEAIDLYSSITNEANSVVGTKTVVDAANKIGKLFINNSNLSDDLSKLFTKEKCTEGMKKHLSVYRGGELESLANAIGDRGAYIGVVKSKFDADAANWVWSEDTANERIDTVITEYKIIQTSNKYLPKTTDLESTVNEWIYKCKNIRISFEASKTYLNEGLKSILEALLTIVQYNRLSDNNKIVFLEAITNYGDIFESFYLNQLEIFKQANSFYLKGLTDEDITLLMQKIKQGVFTDSSSQYRVYIENTVKEYKESLLNFKLKKLWKEKTGSESPILWSQIKRMPIQCMLDFEEYDAAIAAFSAINYGKASDNAINKAIEFISNAKFIEKLSNDSECEKAFREKVLKNYAVILTDTNEVKDYLYQELGNNPYYWHGKPELDKKIKDIAEAKYASEGCKKAIEKIDSMNIEDIKRYVKELIQDNINVGIEIIKEN